MGLGYWDSISDCDRNQEAIEGAKVDWKQVYTNQIYGMEDFELAPAKRDQVFRHRYLLQLQNRGAVDRKLVTN
jgi:hypothetical protein